MAGTWTVTAEAVDTGPSKAALGSTGVAAKLGAPGYHNLTVPHPIWGKDEEGLRELARSVVDKALAQLLP